MATLRYEPEIAAPGPGPDAIRTAIRDADKIPHNSVGSVQMLNYHTNARDGALVRFNPALPREPGLVSRHRALSSALPSPRPASRLRPSVSAPPCSVCAPALVPASARPAPRASPSVRARSHWFRERLPSRSAVPLVPSRARLPPAES